MWKRLASVQSALNTRRVYIYAFPRRGNSAQQHLNEITENKQSKAVQLIFDSKWKKANLKQHDRAILKQNITYLEQILLIAMESSSKFSQQRENTATTTHWKQWPTKQLKQLVPRLLVLSEICYVSSRPQSDPLTHWLTNKICLWLRVCMQNIRPKNVGSHKWVFIA